MSKVHLIGIGGIGISNLARLYLKMGWKVSGSDLEDSEIIKSLRKLGAKIFIGEHKAKNLDSKTNLVIYSTAIQSNNPELLQAILRQAQDPEQRRGTSYSSTSSGSRAASRDKLKTISYPEALGELTKQYFTIAVSGTHGKSTTASMLGLILIKAGLGPTVILGTKLKEFGNSNFRMGQPPDGAKKYLVIEADEWKAAFLNYWPKIIVLTNIEEEHLDYYRDLNHILKTYKEYISHLPKSGILIANKDDKNISKLLTKYAISSLVKIEYQCSLRSKEAKQLKRILRIPGEHNILNALSALGASRALKIPDKISFSALSEYKGAWRRFEVTKYKIRNTKYKIHVINDYAHHPTEIKAALKAAREKFKKRKIWAVFQPHQYQRTHYLFKDFVSAFDIADEVILTKIFTVAGREEKQISKKTSIKKLADEIRLRSKNVHFIKDFKEIAKYLRKNIKEKDVVLIMGAGDIYKLINFL